jgi:flagellar protein FlaI
MPALRLPFELQEVTESDDQLASCGLFKTLPKPMQEACTEKMHLLKYLHMLPIDKIGVPEFYPAISRKQGDLKKRNLIYPVSEETMIHVLSSGEERDLYIPIEPSFGVEIDAKLGQVEERLVDKAEQFAHAETPADRRAALDQAVQEVCDVGGRMAVSGKGGRKLFGLFGSGNSGGGAKVRVTKQELDAIRYMVRREKVGMGVLQPLIDDRNIEDISCSGLGPIYIEHKIFKGMQTAMSFDLHDELDLFVMRLSEQIKRPVTMRNPVVDATLPDGSRINIVYGREVSARGSNFTIRKFADTPLSILELIEFGSIDYRMAAYLSIVLEEGMNAFVSGETASGKTTLMNAITTFVPPAAKVVSIEDTPEVQVPHPNWIREVSRNPRKGEEGATVTMMDLLKAALRQRPNLIIIGEIRGEEGAVAFQAMQTGHAVMATFHASTVEKLIQRLTGHPINIPKTYVENLNIVVIQSAVKLPNGKGARRAMSISEIVGYDPVSGSFSFVEVFRWDPTRDVFEFIGNKNSFLLEEKIAARRGWVGPKKYEIYNLLERRAKILERLHKEKGIKGYYELLKVIARAQQEGKF